MFKRINNLKISTRLMSGFILMISFSVVIGVFAFVQSNVLKQQTETMYNHPLQVRRAISDFEHDILKMQLVLSEILNQKDEQVIDNLSIMENTRHDVENQFDIMEAYYLGPKEDLEKIRGEYYNWIVLQDQVVDISTYNQYKNKLDDSLLQINTYTKTLDDFARNKADELYFDSQNINRKFSFQLIVIIVILIGFSLLIVYYLSNIIRRPLEKLISTTKEFESGNIEARVHYNNDDEFGELTNSFNSMIDSIQENLTLEDKKSKLSGIMLHEDNVDRFFEKAINFMAKESNAQVAIVYQLSSDGEEYVQTYSLGLKDISKKSIKVEMLSRELNLVDMDYKIHRMKDIPDDSRFITYTGFGEFLPKEILTVPINYLGKTQVIISLASIYPFSDFAISFIEESIEAIAARIESILAYHKIKEVSLNLEVQNRELDIQRNEMEAQARELKNQNIELEVQKNQLNEASMLKTNFLSNMSHELRTPLNSVIALAGVLYRKLNGTIPDKEHSYLEVIERNGKNLLLLINDILDISRIEAGKEEYNINTFNINNIIKDLVTMIEPQADIKFIDLIHNNKNQEILIESDDNKIRHIIQNLLSNAIKFTECGEVTIAVIEETDCIRVVVTDTGIGITKKQSNHIFDEFRQADGSTSRRYGGTGLGLSIARKYAHLLGGDILVESELNVGSQFTVLLPYRFASTKPIVSTKKRDALMKSKEKVLINGEKEIVKEELLKKLMVVEDNESVVLQLEELNK